MNDILIGKKDTHNSACTHLDLGDFGYISHNRTHYWVNMYDLNISMYVEKIAHSGQKIKNLIEAFEKLNDLGGTKISEAEDVKEQIKIYLFMIVMMNMNSKDFYNMFKDKIRAEYESGFSDGKLAKVNEIRSILMLD